MTLREFLDRWPTWCEEHGVAWGEPKLCSEPGQGGIVARWHEPRVSLRILDRPTWVFLGGEVVHLLDWQTREFKADWLGLVFFSDHDVERACQRVSEEIGNAIPW